jgi:hypothetical protein
MAKQRERHPQNGAWITIYPIDEPATEPIEGKRPCHAKWFTCGHISIDVGVSRVTESNPRGREIASGSSLRLVEQHNGVPCVQNAVASAHVFPPGDCFCHARGLSECRAGKPVELEHRVTTEHNHAIVRFTRYAIRHRVRLQHSQCQRDFGWCADRCVFVDPADVHFGSDSSGLEQGTTCWRCRRQDEPQIDHVIGAKPIRAIRSGLSAAGAALAARARPIASVAEGERLGLR